MFATVWHPCKDGGKNRSTSNASTNSPPVRSSVDMEDSHATVLKLDDQRWSHWSYFGIFDGHAGYRTAAKAADKLHFRILSTLNSSVAEQISSKSSPEISSSQIEFAKFETAIKDAYFKFDNDWREENRANNPGRRSCTSVDVQSRSLLVRRRPKWLDCHFVFNRRRTSLFPQRRRFSSYTRLDRRPCSPGHERSQTK